MKYECPIFSGSKVTANVKIFWYVGQRSRSMSQGQHFWYKWKDLIAKNVHVKYESHTCNGSNVRISRYVGQRSWSRSQGQTFWYRKPSSKGMYMWSMKALPLIVQKLWHIKFSDIIIYRSKVTVKVTRSNILVWMKRSRHKECSCEI